MTLPLLGEALPGVLQRFRSQAVLGAVLVDARGLDPIERSYGADAYQSVFANLSGLVRSVADATLDGEGIVVAGDTGRREIVILVCSQPGDGDFFPTFLGSVATALQRTLDRDGQRVGYPYARKLPPLGVGIAAIQRNPFRGPDQQLGTLLDEARDAADLHARCEARERRNAFMGLVFGGSVSSVYEPIVDVASRTVFGYEALARGPAGTPFHSPLAMFSEAEEQDLLFELDCLCRKSGLEGATELPDGVRLFLNVRPTTIHDPNFKPDAIIRTLEKTSLRPSDVVFEISEQESIQSFEVFRDIRDEYKSLGFQFALDDTGAGYASLQALIELEPDFIKVDRALVTGLDTDPAKQTLLRALQSVASSIGAKIIGEGLDTLEELEMLGELEIPFGQGWLFGKPTPLRAEE